MRVLVLFFMYKMVIPLKIGQEVMSDPGDLNIGVLFSIRGYSKDSMCDKKLYHTFPIELAEAVRLTIRQVNDQPDFLPNVTLGYHILDGCVRQASNYAKAMYFLPFQNSTSHLCAKQPSQKDEELQICELMDSYLPHYYIIGVIGPLQSANCLAVSPLFSLFNIPQISPTASTDLLSDKTKYKYFFRASMANKYIAKAMVEVIHHFGWSYIGAIYRDEEYGRDGMKQVMKSAENYGICLAYSIASYVGASDEQYAEYISIILRNRKARVVAVFLSGPEVVGFMKVAQKMNGTEDVIWVFSESAFLISGLSRLLPGSNAFVVAMEYTTAPAFESYYQSLTPANNPNNPWFKDAWKNYFDCSWEYSSEKHHCKEFNNLTESKTYSPGFFTTHAIDATLTFAHALQALIAEECPDVFQSGLRTHHQQSCITGTSLLNYMKNVSFNGALGKIQYDKNGDIYGKVTITSLSVQGDGGKVMETIGSWDRKTEILLVDDNKVEWPVLQNSYNTTVPMSVCSVSCQPGYIKLPKALKCCWECYKCRDNEITDIYKTKCIPCSHFTWPDKTDNYLTCFPIPPYFLQFWELTSILLNVFAVLGILGSCVVSFVFYRNRKEKLMKASSIGLMTVIMTGILMEYITVYTFLAPPNWFTCIASRFLFCVSCVMVYAPLLTKTIRVYRIFESGHKGKQRPPLTGNRAQLIISSVLILIQVLILATCTVITPPEASLRMPVAMEKYVELACDLPGWSLLVPLSYNLLLLLLCACFGFMTRHLPNNFNESWYIFLSITTTLFLWIAFIPTYFSAYYAHQKALLLALALVLNGSVTLLCLFIPKIYALYCVTKVSHNIHPLTTGVSHVTQQSQPSVIQGPQSHA